eukprot:gnl/TRDRNA2_/TRDRNA2_201484_c0_seq1.p1 gnl/TRDRNA2_/TRDRNA2_201484_c0~~gnl/TRDRNA2_/TRDRNA2_201484_c0_seq1.p1  ORF type:complete len:144 (+),score=26.86 gnl/TRDRNA2_/TRDRNA2_201484_c0_seq1:64-495(+)
MEQGTSTTDAGWEGNVMRWHQERAAWLRVPLEVVIAEEGAVLVRELRRSRPPACRKQHASFRRPDRDIRKQLLAWELLMVNDVDPEAAPEAVSWEPLSLSRVVPFALEMMAAVEFERMRMKEELVEVDASTVVSSGEDGAGVT